MDATWKTTDGHCSKDVVRRKPFSGRDLGAFSLVELLVVITILAIMAALMQPALSKARKQATAAKCLNNQQQLGYAFHMYALDNSDRIVQMADYTTGASIYPAGGFWGGPAIASERWTNQNDAMTSVQTGLTSSNAYYFYCSALETYHCPADARLMNVPVPKNPNGWAYDSYGRTQNLGGEPCEDYYGAGDTYTKLSAIAMPGITFAMMEDSDWRGYNVGTWAVKWTDDSFKWLNPPAIWHVDVSSVALADGHAELHKWTDPAIVAAGQVSGQGRHQLDAAAPAEGSDFLYIYRGYQFPGHP